MLILSVIHNRDCVVAVAHFYIILIEHTKLLFNWIQDLLSQLVEGNIP